MGARSQASGVRKRLDAQQSRALEHGAPQLDVRTERLVRTVKSRLEDFYGSRLKGLILFGSRARGDFTTASDADVAIVLDRLVERPYTVKCQVIDATYDLFLDIGIIIQPWPVCEDWLEEPQVSPYPHVVRAILREGIRM
jgi:antitoxin ChpS